jgi:hypothetical protein
LYALLPSKFLTGPDPSTFRHPFPTKTFTRSIGPWQQQNRNHEKALGEKLGEAMGDSSLQSGASGAMGRLGMLRYFTAGLVVAMAVGGFNAAI